MNQFIINKTYTPSYKQLEVKTNQFIINKTYTPSYKQLEVKTKQFICQNLYIITSLYTVTVLRYIVLQ
jgi:hypothetical protein